MRRGMEEMARFIREHDRFLVASHHNPDGDAIGAAVALSRLLEREGKHARMYNADGMPGDLAWIDPGRPVATELDALEGFTPDAVILVDCGDGGRVGGDLGAALKDGLFPAAVGVIDHHDAPLGKNTAAAWVDPAAAAAAALVGRLARQMGHALDGTLGEAVYLGLVSDTGSFSFSNTNAEAFELAYEIVKAGLDVGAFTEQNAQVWTLSRLKLWGALSERIRMYKDGEIAGVAVSRKLLEEYGETRRALEGFSSRLRTIRGVRLGILVREEEGGVSRASLRSGPGVDVRRLAADLGGGGHEHAAGVTLKGDAESALSLLAALGEKALSGDDGTRRGARGECGR